MGIVVNQRLLRALYQTLEYAKKQWLNDSFTRGKSSDVFRQGLDTDFLFNPIIWSTIVSRAL